MVKISFILILVFLCGCYTLPQQAVDEIDLNYRAIKYYVENSKPLDAEALAMKAPNEETGRPEIVENAFQLKEWADENK